MRNRITMAIVGISMAVAMLFAGLGSSGADSYDDAGACRQWIYPRYINFCTGYQYQDLRYYYKSNRTAKRTLFYTGNKGSGVRGAY